MKISLNWLQEFVTLTERDPEKIAARVTTGVAEIDDVEEQGALLDDCCIGKVLSVGKHPNADRLTICDVKTDRGTKKIVCGGTNLREGMKVLVAHVGATVRWHGTEMVTLEKTKIRGEESEGMICAAEELDLQSRYPQASEKHILDLGDGDEGVGQSAKEYLNIGDTVLHVDNHAITHRPDLFSHMGFAREVVALGLGKWKNMKEGPEMEFTNAKLPFKCIVDDKKLVPRYCACLLEIDGSGETPAWMKQRLEATGWRSINLPIDITNYVMMETGMPLHSFDADDIKGDFHIRTAKKGEKIVTLDKEERVLPEGAIVLSDKEGIFDLLGIMGGLRSSTKDSTRRIYLHAAIVDPIAIRKTVIATGHRTDAATVYEKGVPRIAALEGLTRAIELFLELAPGARIVSELEEWGDEGEQKSIDLPLERVSQMLGVDIAPKAIVKILEDLEFEVKTAKAKLTVTPPLHRNDVKGTHDLIEEIGRVYGYNDIEPVLPSWPIDPPKRDQRVHILRDALKDQRFVELTPLSLVGPSLLKKSHLDPAKALEVQNALGEELSLLQPSTFPALLEHAQRNLLLAGKSLRTFQMAHVFEKGKSERLELGLLRTELDAPKSVNDEPLLLLKRDLEAAFQSLGYTIDIVMTGSAPPFAHPGRYGDIHLSTNDHGRTDAAPHATIGKIVELHPEVQKNFDLRQRTAVALIDMDTILKLSPVTTIAKPVPQFPAISYDVTLTLSHREQAGDILQNLRGTDPLLENVEVADLYSGKPLQADQYNLTLRFTYRAPDRTLTEEEAKPVHEKVLAKVNV